MRNTYIKAAVLIFSFEFAANFMIGCQGANDYSKDVKKASANSAATPTSTSDAAATIPASSGASQEQNTTAIPDQTGTIPSSTTTTDTTPTTTTTKPVGTSDPKGVEKSVGCTATGDLPEGEASVTINGKVWKYIIRKPKAYARDKVWPLVLAIHPNGGNTSYWDATTGNRAIRPLFGDKAVIMVAQALGGDWRTDLASDRLYFDAIIKKIKENLCIDTKRIFSMGFSGGGSFSGDLGCNRTDIRAIAVGGAVEYFDPKACVGKPAAWITIGDDEAEPARITFRDFWKTYNQCKDDSKVLDPKTCVAYSCPDSNRPVNFCSHVGGHEWPDFGIKTAWAFFSQF